MGNVLSCCHNLSGQQIQPKEVRTSVDPEWSPLLSEENSDEDCPSPSQDTGEAEKSPVLDQGHAFFPDIVLSSSPGAALAAGHSLRNDQGVWNPSFIPDNSETAQAVVSQPCRGEDASQVDLHAVCSHEKPELSKQTADPTEKDIDHNKHNILLMERRSAHTDLSVDGAELDVLQNVAVDSEWAEGDILWSDQQAAAGSTDGAQQHMEHNANQKQQGMGQTGQGVTEQMEQRTGQTEQPLEHGAFPSTAELVKERTLLSEHKSQVKQGVNGDQSVALTELGLLRKKQNATQVHGTKTDLVPMGQNVAQNNMDLTTSGQIVHQSGEDVAQVRQGGEQTTLGLVQPQAAAGQLFQKTEQAMPTDQELMPVYLNVSDEALEAEEQKEQLTLFMVDRLFLATPPITGMM